jgi:hypothetical protein
LRARHACRQQTISDRPSLQSTQFDWQRIVYVGCVKAQPDAEALTEEGTHRMAQEAGEVVQLDDGGIEVGERAGQKWIRWLARTHRCPRSLEVHAVETP